MKSHYFMQLAIDTAFRSHSKFRLGAVLVKKNRVLSTAVNKMNRTHPVQQRYAQTPFTVGLHAEVASCLGVPLEDLEGADLFVARILKSGKPALAKPCYGCEAFLRETGIRRVHFSSNDNWNSISLGI